MHRRRRLTVVLLAVVALAAATAGLVVGAGQGDDGPDEPAGPLPERSGRPLERTSFLARIVPAGEEREQQAPRGPSVPRSVADLARRLPLERKVAQLFLFGFDGTDLNAEIFRRLRRLDLGGIVVEEQNYVDPTLLGQMGGEAVVISREERHVPPWVLTVQDGGEFNSLAGLPPELPAADLASADEAAAQAEETASTLRGLNVTGVLGPVVDVGLSSGSVLGTRVYSDDPGEVAAYAESVVGAYRGGRLFGATKHFPGLGAADQSTEFGPATVGLDIEQLRERDLRPFRAAIRAGVPAVLLSHALYPMNDFTRPASLSRGIVTDLLRGEMGFAGVAVTDDLADPAITSSFSIPDAAVEAVRAGADLLWISGPPGDQQAAYAAVLRAARSGAIPRRRVSDALLRALEAKQDYGLIG